MPEGDTIRRLADRLRSRVAGRVITRSVIRHNRYATTDLTGLAIGDIDAAGKHLLMRLTDDAGRHRATIHSHLRMSGSWNVGIPPGTPAWRRRIELHLDTGPPLVGTDLPVLDIGRPVVEPRWIGQLGPDLCAPVFDVDVAVDNLTATGETPLGQALLDQRNLAGIGNLYAVELPFMGGVSPWTPAGSVEGLHSLVALARAVLPVNARLGPQTTTGLTDRHRQHWIYGRRGKPCPVCRTALTVAEERDVPWGRVTTWCTGCQVRQAVDPTRIRRLLRRHVQALAAMQTGPSTTDRPH